MRNVIRTVCALALIGITPAYAAEYIQPYVPEAKLVGQGRAQVFLWDVYDAKLYAPGGVYSESEPFALELNYLLELKGREIANHAVDEMRRLGYKNEAMLAAWQERMSRIFPDVIPGKTVTGIYVPGDQTIFFADGDEIGRIDDPDFGREFFSIWLDARTNTPGLRRSLLDLNNTMKGNRHDRPAQNPAAGGDHAS